MDDPQPPDQPTSTPLGIASTLSEIGKRFLSRPVCETMTAEESERAMLSRERQRRNAEFASLRESVGRRYRDCMLSSFEATLPEQRAAIQQCDDFVVGFDMHRRAGNGILLFGPPGTGKDHLLVGMARYVILQYGANVMWVNGLDMYGEVRDRMGDDSKSEASFIRLHTRPDILCISDPLPPGGALTDFQKQTVFRIIDNRYREQKPTWATINVTDGADLGQRIGEPIRDRLRDGAVCVHCNWPSYRGRK